jgi:hypothetical protein
MPKIAISMHRHIPVISSPPNCTIDCPQSLTFPWWQAPFPLYLITLFAWNPRFQLQPFLWHSLGGPHSSSAIVLYLFRTLALSQICCVILNHIFQLYFFVYFRSSIIVDRSPRQPLTLKGTSDFWHKLSLQLCPFCFLRRPLIYL